MTFILNCYYIKGNDERSSDQEYSHLSILFTHIDKHFIQTPCVWEGESK